MANLLVQELQEQLLAIFVSNYLFIREVTINAIEEVAVFTITTAIEGQFAIFI